MNKEVSKSPEFSGRVAAVQLNGLIVKDEAGHKMAIRRHLAGLNPGETLDERYHFGDEVKLVASTSASGRVTFSTTPPPIIPRADNLPHLLIDASNVARDGEDDPTRPCCGGAGLWTAIQALIPNFNLEVVSDSNLIYVCSDRASARAFTAIRRIMMDNGTRLDRLGVSGAEADGEILRRVEDSGFTKRVLSNDKFDERKDRNGKIVGYWSDLFPWLKDTALYARLFIRFEFRDDRFVCKSLGINAPVPVSLFN